MATDPAGDSEVLEFLPDAGNLVPGSEAEVADDMIIANSWQYYRDTFYWNKKQWKEYPNDYTKCHIYHWEHDTSLSRVSRYLESEKPPLQSRIWYNYPGQTLGQVAGNGPKPIKIGRNIEGGTQLWRRSYNSKGNLTSQSDPLGRTTVFSYAPNGMDVTTVRQQTGVPVVAVNVGGLDVEGFETEGGQFSEGNLFSTTSSIDRTSVTNPAPESVYQTGRYATDFTATFKNLTRVASHQVRLHFAETYFTQAGKRVFDIYINGKKIAANLDVFVAAGNAKDKAVVREFTASSDANGSMTIRFQSSADNAITCGIEIINLAASTNATLASMTWSSQHHPLTTTDAAGGTTTYTWNDKGQILSVTNPLNQTTLFSYYSADEAGKQRRGRLHQINGALAGDADVVTFDYNGTGRVASVTGPDGYDLDFLYDALDRMTRVTFPDGTYTQTSYHRLDPETLRDRMGRITSYAYNSLRQLESVTDPANRTIGYRWCKCGDLSQLTDAMGRVTTWKHDAAGRVTSKEYVDGSTIRYQFEPKSGRLKVITDEKGQVKTRVYNLDDSLASIRYTNEQHETPDVFWAYDTDFRRLVRMHDGIGTTTYAYHPIAPGTLGAGRRASVDGPFQNDTFTYTYDELGRNTGYANNGVGETRTFDPLGRLLSAVNPLGNFGYTYVGATGRLDTVTYPNGMTCHYNYHPLTGDFRLKDIIHTLPGNTLLSRYSYEYNPVGNITRWTQISTLANINRSWLCGYDAADQLTHIVSQNPDTFTDLPTGHYTYSYDPTGNRLTETIDDKVIVAGYNSLNENLFLAAEGALSSAEHEYQWDAENRLVAVRSVALNRKSEFRYDGRGRMLTVTDTTGSTVTQKSELIWRENTLGQERDANTHEVKVQYFGRGIMTTHPEMVTLDHLGSTREVIGPAGGLLEQFDFDPWGRRTGVTQSGERHLGFTGHWNHVSSGLIFAPRRAYDPGLGRWLSRDRLELAERLPDGPNLYSYVANDPLGQIDPMGLYKLSPVPVDPSRNTIVCDGSGGIIPQIATTSPCFGGCVEEHELIHANDAMASDPGLCFGVAFGVGVDASSLGEQKEAEYRATSATITCLRARLRESHCPDKCKPSIEAYIKQLEGYRDRFK